MFTGQKRKQESENFRRNLIQVALSKVAFVQRPIKLFLPEFLELCTLALDYF